jgi:hypothetical protein
LSIGEWWVKSKHGGGEGMEKKFVSSINSMERMEEMLSDSKSIKMVCFGGLNSLTFENTVMKLEQWTHSIHEAMSQNKSLRIVIEYKPETKVTNFAIFQED